MTKRFSLIFTVVCACLLCVSVSCSKDNYTPGIDGGSPKNYYITTDKSSYYANIQDVVEYLAESNVGDDTGITRLILQMLYNGEISTIAARNYMDIGVMGDWSEKLRFEKYTFKYRTTDGMPNENVSFTHKYLLSHVYSMLDAELRVLTYKDPVAER